MPVISPIQPFVAFLRSRTALKTAFSAMICVLLLASNGHSQGRYATSDNLSGYVHWIDLYDESNTRIDPASENPKPYSPERTCGRCHEFDTISHGWHFNAIDATAIHGRPGQPWIWSDHRTGTHLPLSYRGWKGTYNPDDLGLSRWQVAAKLGGFMPGGGVGSERSLSPPATEADAEGGASGAEDGASGEDKPEETDEEEAEVEDRTNVTGSLPVDCMMCHRNQGSGYSPFVWTEQIEDENFAYAPTAALGLGIVSGSMARLKDDFDANAEGAADKLPKVEYEDSRFRSDGKVFFDLVRKPKSDSCYYCHSNISVDSVRGQRWLHDEDVHTRAGIACADCHRNGLDHLTVRGFEGEQHAAGDVVATLSCQGCHMGSSEEAVAGRLGAPKPAHRGLPPLHFEKLSCTACHSGPVPGENAQRQLNSIAHHLGSHVKRTGDEFPGIVGGVNLRMESQGSDAHEAKYVPHRMMWSSFWGTIKDGTVTVLNPETAYDLIRRPLKVRREFTEELAEVKLSLGDRKELLGEDRARTKEEDYTDEERAAVDKAIADERVRQVGERMAEALAALEEAYPGSQAVYVTGGTGFVRKGEAEIEEIDAEKLGATVEPYAWPTAHNVRPARQSLGATGCLECHSEGSAFFHTSIAPVGLLPDQETESVKVHTLQQADMVRLGNWNQLFAGRSMFKIAGLVALGLTGLITLSALALSVGGVWRRSSSS